MQPQAQSVEISRYPYCVHCANTTSFAKDVQADFFRLALSIDTDNAVADILLPRSRLKAHLQATPLCPFFSGFIDLQIAPLPAILISITNSIKHSAIVSHSLSVPVKHDIRQVFHRLRTGILGIRTYLDTHSPNKTANQLNHHSLKSIRIPRPSCSVDIAVELVHQRTHRQLFNARNACKEATTRMSARLLRRKDPMWRGRRVPNSSRTQSCSQNCPMTSSQMIP